MKKNRITILLFLVGTILFSTGIIHLTTQDKALPIIDMHFHALYANAYGNEPTALSTPIETNYPVHDFSKSYEQTWLEWLKDPNRENLSWSAKDDADLKKQTFELLEKYNIYAIMNGNEEILRDWQKDMPDRITPALWYSQYLGSEPPIDSVKLWFEQGKYEVFAELATQYDGKSPDDPSLEPYFAWAAENDIPVGIHIGTGPPGSPYLTGSPNYRARLHSPMALEEVLVKHPKLRVWIMHAGWPMLDETMAVLFAHPQVYVDIGIISHLNSRKEFHSYLKRIVEAGFGKQVMFGSDYIVWPKALEVSIESVTDADFLSEAQKRDILYNNAARFLKLSQEEIDRHHGK